MSDKRLLKRCGTGKGYLTETQSSSFSPSGLRTTRAEAWANGLRSRILSRSMKTGNVLLTIGSQGFRKERASAPDLLKLIQILREMTSGPERHFLPEIWSQDRTKGEPEGYAVTGKI